MKTKMWDIAHMIYIKLVNCTIYYNNYENNGFIHFLWAMYHAFLYVPLAGKHPFDLPPKVVDFAKRISCGIKIYAMLTLPFKIIDLLSITGCEPIRSFCHLCSKGYFAAILLHHIKTVCSHAGADVIWKIGYSGFLTFPNILNFIYSFCFYFNLSLQ